MNIYHIKGGSQHALHKEQRVKRAEHGPVIEYVMGKSRMRRMAFRCVVPIVLLLDGCGLFSSEMPVEILLPPPPAQWAVSFPGLRFTLLYPDGEGELREVQLPEGCGRVHASCSKKRNAPILVYPWSPQDYGGIARGVLPPAGGLSPLALTGHKGGETLALSWEDGPLAEIFLLLIKTGLDTSRVNSERLAGYMRDIADPWNWDLNKIAERLAAGDFRAYDIDRLPAADARLSGFEGDWFLESPYSEVFHAGADGILDLPGVCYGAHSLFSARGARVGLYVDDRGSAVLAH